MLTRIDRYIARLIFVPLVGTLCLSAMLLVLEKMLRLFDFVVSEGGPIDVVWRMLANMIPEYLGLGIPIGLLLGILLAFRRLALSSELDVFRAVGLSYERLLRVPYLFAAALMGLNLAIVGFVQPYSEYSYQNLGFELRSGALGASIKVGEFATLGDRMTLRVERSEGAGNVLHNVFLRADTGNGRWLAVTAEHGSFLATPDPDTIVFRLTNGRLVHSAPDFRVPRVLSFTTQDLPVELPSLERFRVRGDRTGERTDELTLPELFTIARTASDERVRDASEASIYFRLSEVLMMLLLPLLAVALAVPPKRSSSGFGIFLSIVFVVTYHKVNQYALQMGTLGLIDPLIAFAVPLLIFGGIILWMYWTLAHKPGGQPIGALERVFSKGARSIVRLLRIDRIRRPRVQPAQ